ncbi:NAD(P)H-dependent oxidoreductase [Candidatus Parcubacteria bacterium]|jgi:nitroreductase / dihydropteridine reductase|nr:NAD(P)H-dependent oxidoreductase [Candidatus Parcubacteria bacterium]
MGFLDNLKWRFATKEFDVDRPVSKEGLDKILTAIRMAPTSYGLQSFHVYVVENLDLKKKIKTRSFLQKQIDTCSHLLIFCARTDKKNISQRIDDYIDLATGGDKVKKLKMQPAKLMMKGSIKMKSDEDVACWSSKQCYIALGFGLAAAAELNIDSCPMEGFDKKAVDKILQLPANLNSTVFLAVGNRKEDPSRAKIRFSNEDMFTHN